MKYIFTFILLGCNLIYTAAQSQQYLGSKTLYKPLQEIYTKVPAGYKPVFLNHLGRHGARNLTKDVARSLAWSLVFKADSAKGLNQRGQQLKAALVLLQKVELKHLESISEIGKQELMAIGERAYQKAPLFFAQNQTVLVSTTSKERTKQSAMAFLEGISTVTQQKMASIKWNEKDDINLRFFDLSKPYLSFKATGPWHSSYDQLAKALKLEALSNCFFNTFFQADYAKRINSKDKIRFTDDLYGFYSIIPAIHQEILDNGLSDKDIDLKAFFKSEYLAILCELNDADNFLKKGPGTNNNGIQVNVAAPLLADFINTTDAFLKAKPYSSVLRFGHAETLAPFAAILNLNGASTATKDIRTFNRLWKAQNIIPFSANIQMLVYKNPVKDGYLVKFLLNEKETGIRGLNTKTFPYYPYKEVRAFYLKKLKSLGLDLNSNMEEFLNHIK
ncbi:histidine phosphatase family protein [Pedobacter gandavensis]|uniref:histidine phosphatase family protein n=1 Tax=Pedobacter gandavensis TaxID=2679963 RepID=UPI00292DA919|nr:histidine phosphatase family protein [Pedobacter gandavensis]